MKKIVQLAVLGAVTTAILTACPPSPPPVTTESPDLPKVEFKVAAATRVIPKNAALQSFTLLNAEACLKLEVENAARPRCQARFVFPSADATLATLIVGSVLVGEPSLKAPRGFLMRATAINPQGPSTEVLATEAAFGDAFDQGEAEFDVKLRPDQVSSATALVPGLRFSNGASQYQSEVNAQGARVRPLEVFNFTFNSVVYDDDNNTSTTDDQVRASGSFNFETGDGISAGLKWKKVLGVPVYPNGVYFKVAYGIKSRANVNLTMDINKTIKKEIELASYNFDPITVFVGPVPLVFIPQVIITLNTEGKIAAKTTFSASAKFDAYGCLEYNSGFKNCSSFGQDFSAGLGNVSASLKARATLNVKGNILLYGIVGPYVRAGAYLELEAVVPRNPVWTLTAGAVAGLGLHVDLGIKTLDYDVEFFNKSFGQLAQAENSAPTITLIGPNADLLQNESRAVCLVVNDLEDGNTSATTGGGTVSVSGVGNYTLPAGTLCTPVIKWSLEGLRTVTATVKDSQGKSSSPKTVSFNVVNAPPDIFMKTPVDAQGVTVDTEFPLLAGWKDGNEALDCAKIAWSISGGSTVQNVSPATPDNACGSPSAKVSGVGPHTVTLTVTDSGGKQTALSRTVNAVAKPVNFNAPPLGAILSPKSSPSSGGGFTNPTFFESELVVLTGYVKDADNASVSVKWLLTNLKNNATVTISSDAVAVTPGATLGTTLPVRSFRLIDKFASTCGQSFLITLEITDLQPGADHVVKYEQVISRDGCIK